MLYKLTQDFEFWVRITTEFFKELQEPREIAYVSGSPKLTAQHIMFSKELSSFFKKHPRSFFLITTFCGLIMAFEFTLLRLKCSGCYILNYILKIGYLLCSG